MHFYFILYLFIIVVVVLIEWMDGVLKGGEERKRTDFECISLMEKRNYLWFGFFMVIGGARRFFSTKKIFKKAKNLILEH